MSAAKATETSIRARDFGFSGTRETGGGEIDIYSAEDGVEIRLTFDGDGDPAGVRMCAPGIGVERIVVTDDADEPLSQDGFEALCFELLDDQPRLVFRLTGLTDDMEIGAPA